MASKPAASTTADGETADGDTADGETADGETADGEAADGETADGDAAGLGFSWRRRKNGELQVLHLGRLASTLRGRDALDFEQEISGADMAVQQQAMARLTGNYKHGNERLAGAHPRNRR